MVDDAGQNHLMPAPDSTVVPFSLTDGWPLPVRDSEVTIRETGITLGSLAWQDVEWMTVRTRHVLSLRIDEHPHSDGWVTRHPDGREESMEFRIPLVPTTVPSSALQHSRAFEEWTHSVHGALGRLLVWDDSEEWWLVQEPDLELMVTAAPKGMFSPYSDELSWLTFGTDKGRREVEQLCARYGLAVPTYEDFVSQMHLLVQEQAQLFEFPSGARDLLADGWVQHGPWRPDWCSEALTLWFEAGLLTVFADDAIKRIPSAPSEWFTRGATSTNGETTFFDLTADDARTVLSAPESWKAGTPNGLLMCCPSESGAAADFESWARKLPDYTAS